MAVEHFRIDIVMPDATIRVAGQLAVADPQANGRYRAEFRYDPAWLHDDDRHPEGFDLDPESLPRSAETFTGLNLEPPLAVFDDALPDAWGRKLLYGNLPPRQRTVAALMRHLGQHTLGALRFTSRDQAADESNAPALIDLADLIDSAARFEAGTPVEAPNLARLLAAGSSPGGARPKALVSDAGGAWLAKFPSRNLDGPFDVVGLEAATMRLAAEAGLDVPETRLHRVGARRVLLVRRFDITPAGGRRHMISLKTLCKERGDYSVSHYDDLANAVRKHSIAPVEDVRRLYLQMVFNGVLGNTDDHLKNFWMMRDDAGYRLTPAFDLLPDVGRNGEHVLCFGLDRYPRSARELADIGTRWGVSGALELVERVVDVAGRFAGVARSLEVEASTITALATDIDNRRRRCAAPAHPPPTRRPPSDRA